MEVFVGFVDGGRVVVVVVDKVRKNVADVVISGGQWLVNVRHIYYSAQRPTLFKIQF